MYGLQQAIGWSRNRREARQRQLIGMKAEAEAHVAVWASLGVIQADTASTVTIAERSAPVAFENEHPGET